jgi:hypothetical protein
MLVAQDPFGNPWMVSMVDVLEDSRLDLDALFVGIPNSTTLSGIFKHHWPSKPVYGPKVIWKLHIRQLIFQLGVTFMHQTQQSLQVTILSIVLPKLPIMM